MNKAIFIDKDGTLIRDVPYNTDPALVEFELGAFDALKQLQSKGYLIIIISNQSGIARGFFSEIQLGELIVFIRTQLRTAGIELTEFYFCPHYPGAVSENYNIDCDCRKPAPGMILQASSDFDIELNGSWMIGDILHDVEAGNRAGCRTILIDNGNETEWVAGEYRMPEFKASDLLQAAEYILRNAG